MIFTKDVCPICNELTLYSKNSWHHYCDIKEDHKYYADDTGVNSCYIYYKSILFQSQTISSGSNEGTLRTLNNGFIYAGNEPITVSCETIVALKTEDNILEYIKNLQIMD